MAVEICNAALSLQYIMTVAFTAALKPEMDHLWTLKRSHTILFVDVED